MADQALVLPIEQFYINKVVTMEENRAEREEWRRRSMETEDKKQPQMTNMEID